MDRNNKVQLYFGIQKTDQVIINFIKNIIKPTVQDFDGSIVQVPIVYNGAQRWVQVRQRSHLVDENNNPLYPIISFSRVSTKPGQKQVNRLGFNTETSTIQIQNKYSKDRPFKDIDNRNGYIRKRSFFNITLPIQMQCSYQFQIYTNNNQHMNQLLQLFFMYNNRWWIYYDHRVRVDINDFSNTTQIQTASQRLIKSSFTLDTKSTLLPKGRIQQKKPIKNVTSINKI